MRTFFVLICSLALACTASAKEEKKKDKSASNHAQPVQHESARRSGSGGGPHLQQPKAPQHVAEPRKAPTGGSPAVQPQPEKRLEPAVPGMTTAHPAPALTREQLDEAYARSQGFRSADQYRKWKETGRVEIPAGVATSQTPTAGVGPGSVQKAERGTTTTPSGIANSPADEAYAQSQGFRSAEQFRKWKETGRVEIPAGVAISQTPTAGVGPGSVQKAEQGVTASAIRPATKQAKANPFRPQHFNLQSGSDPAIASVKFQGTGNIQGSESWTGEQYAVFRNYHHEWHDKDWWNHHSIPVDHPPQRPTPIPLPKPSHSPTPIHSSKPSHSPKPSPTPPNPVILVSGGWYFRNACYWYPAWGYDRNHSYYPYDGPIYACNGLAPDQTIANVQAALQALGYYHGPINGILGPLTRTAIANYQRDYGLYMTSAIDEQTVASLGLA
jgi:hypothetical protein